MCKPNYHLAAFRMKCNTPHFCCQFPKFSLFKIKHRFSYFIEKLPNTVTVTYVVTKQVLQMYECLWNIALKMHIVEILIKVVMKRTTNWSYSLMMCNFVRCIKCRIILRCVTLFQPAAAKILLFFLAILYK